MISDLVFLWTNREKPVSWRRSLKVWAKRGYHSFSVVLLLLTPWCYRRRGSVIGTLVVFGKSRIVGHKSNLSIGSYVSLGRCEIGLEEKVVIGDRVVINDGARLFTASHSLEDGGWGLRKAPIVVGDYAWIASNALILPGVTIGRGAVVGAGAVVRKNVPDFALALGNPAVVRPGARTRDLDYIPVALTAAVEAWLGPARQNSRG